MKTRKSNKINLKKLTIAKITVDTMNAVKGGSSTPATEELGHCRATSPGHGRPCVQLY
ncbi:class I lanthipeptide [Aquimarina gracilis]|uniref:Class I lanthipeptide n=2 Tax=Aquimarina gracilis TaxID=874422 RepID=A0ABU5ZZG1_9FLAO|nr:class I lanthipeptide [Aquimarina gracilis]MEB3347284.1 class I lanthipeptide [Aquimarina gracilis]